MCSESTQHVKTHSSSTHRTGRVPSVAWNFSNLCAKLSAKPRLNTLHIYVAHGRIKQPLTPIPFVSCPFVVDVEKEPVAALVVRVIFVCGVDDQKNELTSPRTRCS